MDSHGLGLGLILVWAYRTLEIQIYPIKALPSLHTSLHSPSFNSFTSLLPPIEPHEETSLLQMSLIDSLKFQISFFISWIPIQIQILHFLSFSLMYKLIGVDPVAQETFPSVESLPSPNQTRKREGGVCPYAKNWETDGHKYRPPQPGDYRSPCPALNTMANHGYIPRDGKHLTGTILTHALIECYNLSWPLAGFLAWGGVLLLGQVGELSLHDLARHNRIEHDASLTHPNSLPGEEYAPTHTDEGLYKAFLNDASKDGRIRAVDIARARIRREKEPDTEMTPVQQEIARGEVALVLQIFGGNEFAIPLDVIESWWLQEKLPDGWRPTRKTTLLGTIYWSSQIRHAMEKMREEGEKAKKEKEGVAIKKETWMVHVVSEKMNGTDGTAIAHLNGLEFEQMNRLRSTNGSYTSPATTTTTNGTVTTNGNDAFESRACSHSRPTRKQSIPVAAAA